MMRITNQRGHLGQIFDEQLKDSIILCEKIIKLKIKNNKYKI